METLDIEKFSPKVAELNALVALSIKITATDLKDSSQLEIVKRCRIDLGKARIEIEKTGKFLREKANAFNKAVLDKQKELVAIVEPEEKRLKAIEEEAKELKIKELRLMQLPNKKARLESIDDNLKFEDEYILTLNDEEFESYYNQRVANKNEADRLKIEKTQAESIEKLQAERDAIAEEKRLADEEVTKKRQAEQDALKIQQDKIDADKRELEAEKLRIKHEEELRVAKEKAKTDEAERIKIEDARIKAEKIEADKVATEELAKREEYQKFLASNGYTIDTQFDFMTTEKDGVITLFKKVAEFKK